MKYLNIIGGMLCVLAIWIGSHSAPPGPGPKPDPQPVVVDEKPLIDGEGLHVLILEDRDGRANLPAEQRSVLLPSAQLIGWLKDHQAQWRIFVSEGQDVSHDDAKWQAAYRDIRPAQLPWIVVSNRGRGAWQGPLPANVSATLGLLAKYAGPGSPSDG